MFTNWIAEKKNIKSFSSKNSIIFAKEDQYSFAFLVSRLRNSTKVNYNEFTTGVL